jgi:hypothetical protein
MWKYYLNSYELFIGIDFSKKTFDASVIHRDELDKENRRQFENTKERCGQLTGKTGEAANISEGVFMAVLRRADGVLHL